MTYSVGALCMGYGGLELGLSQVLPTRLAWYSEVDPHACTVLAERFPDVPNLGDLTAIDWSAVEAVDVVTAGYPCQPFSHAGKRQGTDDDRHLWPYISDALRVLRPRYGVFENVRGHLSLGFDSVLADLAAGGFDAEWTLLRAADVGAPHGRARLFIVAADAGGERHGGGQDGRTLGRVDSHDAVQARQRQRARQEPRDQGAAAPTDTDGLNERPIAAGNRPRQSKGAAGDSGGPPAHATGYQGWQRDRNGDAAADATFQRRQGEQGVAYPAGPLERPVVGAGGGVGTGDSPEGVRELGGSPGVAWGQYAAAIQRWERVTQRSAPAPVELAESYAQMLALRKTRIHPKPVGMRGSLRPRRVLSPRLVEWLMGLPEGWVTDLLPRSPALKVLGNGVVPQQAAAALSHLLTRDVEAAA